MYQDGFGIRKSERMRAEKIAMSQRFREEETAVRCERESRGIPLGYAST